ncbi:unnamed protein product [Sphagnum troendelagicum]|jgi:hypothetical protein
MAGSISRMLRVALNRHPLQTRAQCSSTLLIRCLGCFPSAIGPSTTLHLTTTRHVARQAQFHEKPGTVPAPSSSLVGQPLGRGQGRYPRMLPRALQSPPSAAPPTYVWRRDCLLYTTVAVRLWFGQDEPGQLHLSTREGGLFF